MDARGCGTFRSGCLAGSVNGVGAAATVTSPTRPAAVPTGMTIRRESIVNFLPASVVRWRGTTPPYVCALLLLQHGHLHGRGGGPGHRRAAEEADGHGVLAEPSQHRQPGLEPAVLAGDQRAPDPVGSDADDHLARHVRDEVA